MGLSLWIIRDTVHFNGRRFPDGEKDDCYLTFTDVQTAVRAFSLLQEACERLPIEDIRFWVLDELMVTNLAEKLEDIYIDLSKDVD
ncbi:MAG: hypothetical protein GY776_07070 [Alteromonas sp.]|nr:hypothetical protein [Alteromonas sp.]